MRVAILTLALSVLALAATPSEATRVKVLRKWESRITQADQKYAPKSGYLAGPKAMAKLWKDWKIPGALPKIDWKKELVLVSASEGSWIHLRPELDLLGNLTVEAMVADNFTFDRGYVIAVIPLAGIKTVQGKKLVLEAVKPEEPKD